MAGKKRRSPEAARAAREEKLSSAQQQITDYVAQLTTGEDWKRWLALAAQFPRYSFRNQILIAQQNPDATLVQGYRAWQGMGRQVRKGEKGLTILGPRMGITGWRDANGTVFHAAGQISKTDVPDGATPVRSMVGVTPVTVFDVSQTEGDPLPQNPVPDPVALDGPAPDGMRAGLESVIDEHGFTVQHDASLRGEDGHTNHRTSTINITPGHSDAQEALTLAHETAHMLLHSPEQHSPDQPLHRGVAEVEAESVAYLVASQLGYDTSANSFPYVTGWAGTENPQERVASTADRVVATAGQVLDRIEQHRASTDEPDAELQQRAEIAHDTAHALNTHAAAEHDTEPAAEPATTEPAAEPAGPAQLALLGNAVPLQKALQTRAPGGADKAPSRGTTGPDRTPGIDR